MKENIHASRRGKVVMGLILVIVWCVFTYFAYTYSKDYFDTSIKELDDKYYKNYEVAVIEINTLKEDISTLKGELTLLNENINSFNENMTQVFEDVSGIDSVINETSVLQEATTKKLEELDSRLIELIDNLEILKKAPNE